MEQFLSDAKRLVQRLHNHDNSVDILISETTNLQNKLIAMRQYHEEVNKMNENANHRPRSTLVLGSQLENQRIQNLEQENRELSVSLAEHQSALELIMNKYREQVLVMMKANGTDMVVNTSNPLSAKEVFLSERIAEMANVMRRSALIDESESVKEIEILRSLQVENENLRDLLKISGQKLPKQSYNFDEMYANLGGNLMDSNYSAKNITAYKKDVVNNKDSGIYGSQHSSLHHVKQAGGSNTNLNRITQYDSLEKFFQKPTEEELSNNAPAPSFEDGSENFFVSASPEDNCFRAIITDIKPLEHSFDTNNDPTISVDENTEPDLDFEVSDESSNISEHHVTETNEKIKKQLEQDSNKLSNVDNDKNVTNGLCNGETDAIQMLDNILDLDDDLDVEYEKEEQKTDFVNSSTEIVVSENDADVTLELNTNKSLINAHAESIVPSNNTTVKIDTVVNGDVSDDDSEATFTEDDVSQALSGFDSFLDDEIDVNGFDD